MPLRSLKYEPARTHARGSRLHAYRWVRIKYRWRQGAAARGAFYSQLMYKNCYQLDPTDFKTNMLYKNNAYFYITTYPGIVPNYAHKKTSFRT